MSWFFLVVLSVFFVLIIRNAWRARKPEGVRLGDGQGPVKYLLTLVCVGVGAIVLFDYTRDTGAYWRLAEVLMWLTGGLMIAMQPRYSELGDAQQHSIRRRLAAQWWVTPTMAAVFLATTLPLALLAPRWLVETYLTAFFCMMAARMVWLWRVSYEPSD
jgi:hypothetical protein